MGNSLEILAKGPNYWKDKNPKKYKQMLAQLRRERKTPGSKERAYQQVLQAKRREHGAPGTKAGKNGNGHISGHMQAKTGTAVKRYQSSEKQKKIKLSIDRKNNNKGYTGNNTRLVPQKLNRGRHNVDSKKLAAWRKRLKKSNLTTDDLLTLLRAKALHKSHDSLYNLLGVIDIERFLLDVAND